MLSNDTDINSRLDLAFASFLSQRSTFQPVDKQRFAALLTALSQQQRQGHTCIEITADDKALLLASEFACEFPHINPQTYPLIIEADRLYLQRYWFYEDRLARQINGLARITYDTNSLENLLDRYFVRATENFCQREAAKMSCEQAFCIITGGPGAGKTTTVCKILGLLQELADKPLLIALAAPTGKAAMRLQEAIVLNLSKLDCPQHVKEHIPQSAVTLHRLLGAIALSPYFKHQADNFLPYDLVVVDEASMVDLAMMSKLVDALKPGARLILLGDKDQLASVESGTVLADLIAGLPNNTVELAQSYRFDEGIKKLADAVNQQDHEAAWSMLIGTNKSVELIGQSELLAYILEQRREYVRLVKTNAGFAEIFREFGQFQVLCSNRNGFNGSLAINYVVEQSLFPQLHQYGHNNWYPGRPVLVTQNNPTLHLYNGDIGICLPDNDQNNNLMVFFQKPDGIIKKFLPARMPSCETVFAMTIHKAQGSEFKEALIVLPPTVNPVLSKELLYTAITRAKKSAKIMSEQSVFTAAINKKIGRLTGLATKLMQ